MRSKRFTTKNVSFFHFVVFPEVERVEGKGMRGGDSVQGSLLKAIIFSHFSVVSRCHSSKANRNNLLNIKCTHDSSLTTLAGVVVVVVGWALLKHRIMGCNLHSIKCFYMHVFAVYNFSWENIL